MTVYMLGYENYGIQIVTSSVAVMQFSEQQNVFIKHALCASSSCLYFFSNLAVQLVFQLSCQPFGNIYLSEY